jgi:hypothetical protein
MQSAAAGGSIGRKQKAALLALAFDLVACTLLSVRLWKSDAPGTDVYFDWLDGWRILTGENPYDRCSPATCATTTSTPLTFRFSSSCPD